MLAVQRHLDWRNHLDTQGSRDMARLNTFIDPSLGTSWSPPA